MLGAFDLVLRLAGARRRHRGRGRLRQPWLAERFDSVTLARRLDNGAGIDNEEQGMPAWVCRGLRGSWASTWVAWRHYDG